MLARFILCCVLFVCSFSSQAIGVSAHVSPHVSVARVAPAVRVAPRVAPTVTRQAIPSRPFYETQQVSGRQPSNFLNFNLFHRDRTPKKCKKAEGLVTKEDEECRKK